MSVVIMGYLLSGYERERPSSWFVARERSRLL